MQQPAKLLFLSILIRAERRHSGVNTKKLNRCNGVTPSRGRGINAGEVSAFMPRRLLDRHSVTVHFGHRFRVSLFDRQAMSKHYGYRVYLMHVDNKSPEGRKNRNANRRSLPLGLSAEWRVV